ncbi:MAG: hypothetical protein MGAcid_18570 [uncultured Acidilobus sp. MG]|nr:MAG: hypothetical protein MGAcid_18570 [uncultured Acidilobus sp. MG]
MKTRGFPGGTGLEPVLRSS